MLFSEHHRITSLNKGSWLLGNINQTGYFRVNYDLRNWRLLIDQLIRNHEVNWIDSSKICFDMCTPAILILFFFFFFASKQSLYYREANSSQDHWEGVEEPPTLLSYRASIP